MLQNRTLKDALLKAAKKFPAIALTGPRQSGKSTLAQEAFPKKKYLSLEDPDTQRFAINDPRSFLENLPNGAILDEAQRAPELFSYLQGILDRSNKPGLFILTGSQNFLLNQQLSQSLAGRIRIFHLLPFSLEELASSRLPFKSLEAFLFKGMYPRIHDKKINPREWYQSYLQTYLERDVRQLKHVGDLHSFQTFIRMCASRTGQILNLSSLGSDCGITHNTAKSWISILEASFICFLLSPHHANFNKRLIKSPKLYFYDAGLACALIGIEEEKQLFTHPLRGALFETAVISEFQKFWMHRGFLPACFFWRDQSGFEVDCIWESGGKTLPIEIKSGKTISDDFFKGLRHWKKLSKTKSLQSLLIYGGNENQKRTDTAVLSWKELSHLTNYLR